MANRYANLVGTKKINEDFNNINIGFDRVQAEMDTKGTPADAQAKADAAKAAAIAAAAEALAAHKARGADEHPTAKGNAAGFMSAADKLKSDASTSAATPDTLMQRDAAGRAKVTAPAAADDIARKAETDAVQTNLDSHAADTDIHVTADDHDKLDGIAAGAEVNQNAFAKVNDVEASSKSDTLQLTGGTGITVTTDPATKRVTVTATGTATPGAHATSHVTGGSDVIPDAVTGGASGLMSGADAKFVREDGESKSGAQTKADAAETAAKAYTDGQIEGIADRLDTPERSAITLQPGIQVVQADQDSPFSLTGLQGRTVINYQSQIGIYGVLNPYVIRYGANLLPPFYEWGDAALAGSNTFDNPYQLKMVKASGVVGFNTLACKVNAASLTDYTLAITVDMSGIGGTISAGAYWNAGAYAEDGTLIEDFTQGPFVTTNGTKTMVRSFKSPANTKYVRLVLGLDNGTTGTAVFRDVTLNVGTSAKPFKPRQDAMLALQTELHANPNTGAIPDTVFERDGQYFRLAKWKKLTLDGNRTWVIGEAGGSAGLKQVKASGLAPNAVAGSGIGTKFDGKLLAQGSTGNTPDTNAVTAAGDVYISIPSTDSGWGDNYTNLTTDEIKAYFMGWTMSINGQPRYTPYNGSGTKVWIKTTMIKNLSTPMVAGSDYTTTLPTFVAGQDSAGLSYPPYQLLYQLATPVVEPITSEGQLTFVEGANQVEVGTGIVLRESAKPQISDYGTYINSAFPGFEQTKLKYRTSKILTLFKNGKFDPSWVRNTLDAYGLERAVLSAYEPSAAYSVTYLMLDKYPAVDFAGTYAENEKALLLDAVKSIQENTTRISVLESKKAEKDSPAWITPTLVNGWIQYPGYPTAQYVKDSSEYVHIRGLIKGGVRDAGKRLFVLPEGFRPKTRRIFNVLSFGTTTPIGTTVEITEDGNVYLGTSASETWLNLEGISFNINL